MKKTRKVLEAAAVLVGLALAGAFAWALLRSNELPTGPVPVAWDKAACAHCQMHVGEPAFAAQLQTRDGRVHDFDDPGCLVEYVAKNTPSLHAIYFHHMKEDRWLNVAQVGFTRAPVTPMGYGYGAVDRHVEGAIPFEAFSARVLAPEGSGAQP